MTKEYKNFEINDKASGKSSFIWSLPFYNIKRDILGDKHECVLNFIDKDTALALNKKYRGKDYFPNILSFTLDDDSGEIYVCRSVAREQYKNFDMRYQDYIVFLFIHGCLHLKGVDHDTAKSEESMVKLEYEFYQKYKEQKYSVY